MWNKVTAEQCVKIAEIINPDVSWGYYLLPPERKWQGHDIVSKEMDDYGYKYIVQIGHDGKIIYYDDGYTDEISQLEYLKINKILQKWIKQ